MKKKKAKQGGLYAGLTNKGFNYNSAWGGAWQNGGNQVNIDSVLNANKHLDFVKRMYEPNTPTLTKNGESMTHFMESGDGMVYPRVVNDKGKLKLLSSKKARNYAEKTGEFIKFDNDLDAQYFGKNYKQGTGVLKQFQSGGNMKFYQEGLDWLPKSMQTGGNLPDSVNNEIMLRQLYRESRFKDKVENKGTKAKGLAQLRPIAIEELKNKYKMVVDPFNPKQAIKGHKKLMTVAYNKPWINKAGTTDDVRVAKSLAAYNWGPTSLVNQLNTQKEKGVDIYKSLDWVKSLPQETQDYINDVTGKNPKFEEEYKKAIVNFKFKGAYPIKKQGGVIEDNMGQWKHPGKVTKINSNNITMKGVNYPVLGVSDTGDQKMMYPEQDYQFEGNSVTEYPTIEPINWLDKYEKAQDGTSILSYLNPKNWGVEDYTDRGDFNTAFKLAKKANKEEFMWNSKRYNTKSNLPASEQLKHYGIPDEQRLPTTGIKGYLRKNLAENLSPFGYDEPLKRVFEAGVLGKKEKNRVENEKKIEEAKKFYQETDWEDKGDFLDMDWGAEKELQRIDYNNIYFGQPQKYNTLSISKSKPSKSTDKNAIYYSNEGIRDRLESLKRIVSEQRGNQRDSTIANYIKLAKEGKFDSSTGAFTLSQGRDEKGPYVSYYDKWDLAPGKGSGGKDESRGLGKPFELYDKVYLDDGEVVPFVSIFDRSVNPEDDMRNGGWLDKYK